MSGGKDLGAWGRESLEGASASHRLEHLAVLDEPSAEILGASADEFLGNLERPTLIRVGGRDTSRTRGIVTLLHGNEPSGLRAVRSWLSLRVKPAVNSLIIIPGVQAALTPPRFTQRVRPGGRDLNRCFLPPYIGEDAELAQEIMSEIRRADCEAVIDLHNNTGHSPIYGVGPVANDECLALTSLFARRFVLTDLRLGALMEALAPERPAVTIESGRAGDPAADAAALAGLERFLHAEHIEPMRPKDEIDVFESPLRVRVASGTRLAFASQPADDADLTLSFDVDRHNFETLEAGHAIGWLRDGCAWPIEVLDGDGDDISRSMFAPRDGRLIITRELIPIMMTTQPEIALQDCLFYAVRKRGAGG